MINYKRLTRPSGKKYYVYERICQCGDVAWITYKPKADTLCKACSSFKNGSALGPNNIKTEEEKIRYKHTCPICDTVRMLRSRNKTELCKTCNGVAQGSKKPANPKGRKMKTPKAPIRISKEAVARMQRLNRAHRAAQAPKPREPKAVLDTSKDSDMIEAFLKDKKPSVIDTVEKIPHLVGGNLGSRTSVLD